MFSLNDSVSSLKEASDKALEIFKSTITNLNNINSKINEQKTIKIKEIDNLQSEYNLLDNQEKQNTKIIEKITFILE